MPQFMFWVWLSVVIVATVIELMTLDMTSIWFAIAGLIALIFSLFDAITWEIQLSIFIVLSSALMLGLRNLCKKFLLRHTEGKTNIESLIGKQIKMLTDANFDTLGSAKINDIVWSVKSSTNVDLKAGEIVEIVALSGNKLLVKKI